MDAKQIITILADKYGFNADEAFTYYESKVEVKSTGSQRKPKRTQEQKLRDDIAELKASIPSKKGKFQEKAQAKLAELEAKLAAIAPAPAPATPPKKADKEPETPKAPKKAAKEDDDRRIKRMSPLMGKQLAKAFEEASVEFKKDTGDEFKNYINSLTKDDFDAHNLADHMREFAKGKAPAPAPTPAHATDFTPKEPEAVPDEETTDVEFNGVKYVVGNISKRVYEADDEDGDRFAGFLGLGKFADMKIPA